jgi:hypothetical protein
MIVEYSNWISRYRWPVILLSLVITALAGVGLKNFKVANDYKVYFDKDFPPLMVVEEIENTYTNNENVLFVLTAKDGELFSNRNLAAVEWLTAESWNTPYSSRVDSLSNFQHTYAEADDLIVEDLIAEADSLSASELANIEKIARNEPRLVKYLVNADKAVTGINITIQLPGENRIQEVQEIIDFANNLEVQFEEQFPYVEMRQSGLVVMNSYFSSVAQDDTAFVMPILFACVFFGLWFFLRSFFASLSTMIVIVMSIVTAMGAALWSGFVLTPPSMASPLMILTLAVAHCVHLLVAYLNDMAQSTETEKRRMKEASMAESLRINFSPIAITSFTTLLGFLSLNFSDSPPFRDMGNIVAIGVIVSWFYSVFTLPALIQLLPIRGRKATTATGRRMEAFANIVIQRRRPLTGIMILVVAVLCSFVANNRLDDTYAHYFDETVDFRLNADYTDQNLTGTFPVNFSIETDEENGIYNPEVMAYVKTLTEWLRVQPEVGFVSTLSDTMKQLNQNMNGGEAAFYKLPEQRELSAQYLLLYEMSLPYGLDLANQINIDKSGTRIFANTYIMPTSKVWEFKQRGEQWIAANTPDFINVEVGAPPYMFARLGKVNAKSMLIGSASALVMISFILIFALRSLKIGLVSLVPNIVPAAMAFGVWGIIDGEVGLSLVMVLGMTMGIVVDDTVHLLSKYLRARREQGLNPPDSIRYAFSTVGTALWATSIVLIAGFAFFAFAHFEPNSNMGILTAITIALALVADFLLLPVLILLVDKDKPSAEPADQAAEVVEPLAAP